MRLYRRTRSTLPWQEGIQSRRSRLGDFQAPVWWNSGLQLPLANAQGGTGADGSLTFQAAAPARTYGLNPEVMGHGLCETLPSCAEISTQFSVRETLSAADPDG